VNYVFVMFIHLLIIHFMTIMPKMNNNWFIHRLLKNAIYT